MVKCSGVSYSPFKPSVNKEASKPKSILSSKEIMERRAKGQCFHCDERYHPGQECKAKLYQLVGEDEIITEGNEIAEVVDDMAELLQGEEQPGELSINALAWLSNLSTIRMKGTIKTHSVYILIDSGSTHSFINSDLVDKLHLTAQVVTPLAVFVADGSKMLIDSVCLRQPYEIQGHKFQTDLRPFPLG